jgi:hypothetical protein
MYFNEFWMTNLRKYEHIIHENSDFMSQDWEKINQKFVYIIIVKYSYIVHKNADMYTSLIIIIIISHY